MDKPFSALDVFTAEGLRREVYRLVMRVGDEPNGKAQGINVQSVLLITHNIEEAVFLAGRVVVMRRDPGPATAGASRPPPAPEQLFETMVGWPRYAELFGYEPQAEILYLDEPDEPSRPPGEAGYRSFARAAQSLSAAWPVVAR
jgi:ABC-type sugar transport system ATPase subunit